MRAERRYELTNISLANKTIGHSFAGHPWWLAEALENQQFYDEIVKPKMWPHQRLMVVPGLCECSDGRLRLCDAAATLTVDRACKQTETTRSAFRKRRGTCMMLAWSQSLTRTGTGYQLTHLWSGSTRTTGAPPVPAEKARTAQTPEAA